MNRALAVTLVSSLISVAAAGSLLAEPKFGILGPACETQGYVVATGTCPTDKVAACKHHMGQECGINEDYSTCQNSTPEGYFLYCYVD